VKEDLPVTVEDDDATISAATGLAKKYSVMQKDIMAQIIVPVTENFSATINQIFRTSPSYGAKSQTQKGDVASNAIMCDVSEQLAFALDNMLPDIQMCAESLLQLRTGGSELCEKFLHRICKTISECYVAGLTTDASERVLHPHAVNQICTDIDAIRAALSAFNPVIITKSMAPLLSVTTYLRTTQIPPDSPLPPSAVSELEKLHILKQK